MFHEGQKIKGIYQSTYSTVKHSFTGHIYELHCISTILLDRAIYPDDKYTERLYAEFDHNTGKGKKITIEAIPDVVGSECNLLPLSAANVQDLERDYRQNTYAFYKQGIERRLTTWKTVKQSVTCEYGHKHMVDKRIEVKPELCDKDLFWPYFFFALAEYFHYLDNAEYRQKNETWHNLAGKLSLGGGTFMHGSNRITVSYTGIDKDTEKKIRAELHEQYELMCNEYLVKIYGKHLDRYLSMESRISGGNRRADMVKQGLISK